MNAPAQVTAQNRDVVTTFKNQVAKSEGEFRAALPAHIPVERFMRVVNTAVNGNPDLLKADRVSLFQAAVRAAQDGLLPDGRDGALVVYGTKVQWMPMIGGILKKVRNSGELKSIAAHVVYERDEFTYSLGDEEKIEHRPALGERGNAILAYAIAHTKDGGVYREVMTVADIEKVRAVSKAGRSGPWVQWWGEMARKTVLRRLSKRLPMSTDLDDLIRRDDALYDFDNARVQAAVGQAPRSLSDRIQALAAAPTGNVINHDPETGEIHEEQDQGAEESAEGEEGADQAEEKQPPKSEKAKPVEQTEQTEKRPKAAKGDKAAPAKGQKAAAVSEEDLFAGQSSSFRFGFAAYEQGVPRAKVPSVLDPNEAEDWEAGWSAAAKGK
jgi:recombination protein RecT